MAFKRAPKRKSQQRFSLAPQVGISRSTFDLSYPLKTTFDGGWLVPLPPIEVLPGDSFRLRMTALTRLATPLHPTMDNLHLSSFWFFVPNRLVWENWQAFMGEQENPGDSTDYVIPKRTITGGPGNELTLQDYFNLPVVGHTGDIECSDLPFRGYNLCVREWFRDQNLQDSPQVDKGDAVGDISEYVMVRRGKRKNYLTSSLPWPQKGPGVEIPIGTTAPVLGIGMTSGASWTTPGTASIYESGADTPRAFSAGQLQAGFGASTNETVYFEKDDELPFSPNIRVDLENATGATINDWREAFQIQKLQERDARGGTRYTEILKSHFQVVSPDSRLQRPEILATGRSPIQMHTVPQTSSTSDSQGPVDTPQGNLAAFGQGIVNRHGFTKSFVEHGYILGMINVRADLNFQQRLDRHWSRSTKYDFYWPALQALGEQPVYNQEIYADGTSEDQGIWGYQERWAEYRTSLGAITGLFRSAASESLDPWHYALDFGDTRPVLNGDFIEDQPPIARTIAVQDKPEFIMDAWVDIKAARPMPVYSVPGYIDHF
jgi:hypothetical protein